MCRMLKMSVMNMHGPEIIMMWLVCGKEWPEQSGRCCLVFSGVLLMCFFWIPHWSKVGSVTFTLGCLSICLFKYSFSFKLWYKFSSIFICYLLCTHLYVSIYMSSLCLITLYSFVVSVVNCRMHMPLLHVAFTVVHVSVSSWHLCVRNQISCSSNANSGELRPLFS